MVQDFGTSNKALISLVTAKKELEREYNTNLEEVKKWDERIKLAKQNGKSSLAAEALNRRNFYVGMVAEIRPHIDRLEKQITSAKQTLASVPVLSSPKVESVKISEDFDDSFSVDILETIKEKKLVPQNYPFDGPSIEEQFRNLNPVELGRNSHVTSPKSSLDDALSKAIKEIEDNIGQAKNQYQEIKSQYLQFQKKVESFHNQALDFIEKGESNAASIALSSEVTTKNLLNSLEIQINNQMSLIGTLERHLEILTNLHNNSKGIVQSQDDCVDSELEKLRKKLREL
jgi:hypothetical protein